VIASLIVYIPGSAFMAQWKVSKLMTPPPVSEGLEDFEDEESGTWVESAKFIFAELCLLGAAPLVDLLPFDWFLFKLDTDGSDFEFATLMATVSTSIFIAYIVINVSCWIMLEFMCNNQKKKQSKESKKMQKNMMLCCFKVSTVFMVIAYGVLGAFIRVLSFVFLAGIPNSEPTLALSSVLATLLLLGNLAISIMRATGRLGGQGGSGGGNDDQVTTMGSAAEHVPMSSVVNEDKSDTEDTENSLVDDDDNSDDIGFDSVPPPPPAFSVGKDVSRSDSDTLTDSMTPPHPPPAFELDRNSGNPGTNPASNSPDRYDSDPALANLSNSPGSRASVRGSAFALVVAGDQEWFCVHCEAGPHLLAPSTPLPASVVCNSCGKIFKAE
jgi:hypothetical protein